LQLNVVIARESKIRIVYINTATAYGDAKVNTTRKTILVVDDTDDITEMTATVLRLSGCNVVTARDGEEGMALMERRGGDFDAVLLDMTMPRLSGADTCHLIRQLRPELPIVLTSGYTEPDAEARLNIGGVAGFLQKPFTPATLVKVIQDAVRRAAQERG